MEITDRLLEAVKTFEGCKLYAYRDSGGVLTIGYGHTKGVKAGQAITQKQADALLRQDLTEAARQVEALGLDWLTQEQKEALTDFVFNLGIGNLKRSTLLKDIRARKSNATIASDIRAWVYCKGKVLPGLVKRREWEASAFEDQQTPQPPERGA